MTNPEHNKGEDPLSNTLHQWRLDAPLPPGFQDSVWRRIDQANAPRPGVSHAIQTWIDRLFARPAAAALSLALLLSAGMTFGWSQGQRENSRVKGELANRYVHSIDPYLAPRQ